MVKPTKKNNKEYIPLSFDLMFKKVFADEEDKSSLICLLDYILDIKVDDVTILNPEIIASNFYDKGTTVDLIVKLEDGTVISIEMNTNTGTFVIVRNLFYLTKIMSKNIDSENSYLDLHKHIQVNFDTKGKHTNPIMKYCLLDEETHEKLTDKIEIIRIDVGYFKELCYTKDASDLDLKTRLIGLVGIDNREIAESITRGDDKLEHIIKKVEKFSDTEEIIGAYDIEKHRKMMAEAEKEEARREAKQQGIEQGVVQGVKQGLTETAKNMLKDNVPVEIISKYTGLSIEEINALL